MPCNCGCNCGCNNTLNAAFVSNCDTCEPNAANVNLLRCAGYGFDNRCNCACPPSSKTAQAVPVVNGINTCGCDTGCTIQPTHVTPFNPVEELTKRASQCVVDHIADATDQQIAFARTAFTERCVRNALGLDTAPIVENNDCAKCGCHKHSGCNCGSNCGCSCSCKCYCKCSCDYEALVQQTVQAVANEMSEELLQAVNCIAEKYAILANNIELPCTTPVAVTTNACVVNQNTGCGACPTAGRSTNATTWGRCH